MFNIGGGEMVVIGVVALIVVGPKDLPKLFRSTGQFIGRMRGMADDFRRTMEAAADDSGVSDLKRDFDEMGRDVQGMADKDPLGLSDIDKMNDINESATELESELKAELSKPVAKKRTLKKIPSANKASTQKTAVEKTSIKKPRIAKSGVAKTAPKKSPQKSKARVKPTKPKAPKK